MNSKEKFMAIVKGGLIAKGLSGALGKQVVFKQYRNKTVVAAFPVKRNKKKLTDSQEMVRRKFTRAAMYARMVLNDPVLKATYAVRAKKGKSAYNNAFKDAIHAPQISEIDIRNYTGRVNDVITVIAFDDFKVTEVKLRIFSPEGVLIEEGEARLSDYGIDWEYSVNVENPQVAGSTIEAFASDLPRNQGTMVVKVKD